MGLRGWGAAELVQGGVEGSKVGSRRVSRWFKVGSRWGWGVARSRTERSKVGPKSKVGLMGWWDRGCWSTSFPLSTPLPLKKTKNKQELSPSQEKLFSYGAIWSYQGPRTIFFCWDLRKTSRKIVFDIKIFFFWSIKLSSPWNFVLSPYSHKTYINQTFLMLSNPIPFQWAFYKLPFTLSISRFSHSTQTHCLVVPLT